MKCFTNLGRVFVVIINLIFVILSLAFLIIGFLIKYHWSWMFGIYIEPMLKVIETTAKDAGENLSTATFDFDIIISDLAIALIVIGFVFLVLGVFGCVGACYKIKFMLIGYVGVCVALLLAQIIFVIILFSSDIFQSNLRKPMVKSIKEEYTGYKGNDVITLGVNFVQVYFQCCGINNYRDFHGAAKWNRQFYAQDIRQTKTLVAPVFCCKMKGSFPNAKPDNYNCAYRPTIYNSNYKKGCFKAVENWLSTYKYYFLGAGIVAFILQLMLIGFSIAILLGMKKEKIRPM